MNQKLGDAAPDRGRLVYIDALGTTGAGSLGFAVLPEHDLKAMVQPLKSGYAFPPVTGGHAHEIGHLLGLGHAEEKDRDALMLYGYTQFPRCYLTRKDRADLQANGYIQRANPSTINEEIYVYEGGCFLHLGGPRWEERKADTGAIITFVEEKRDREFIYLLDPTRGMNMKLPIREGRCYWKTPSLSDWVYIYDVKK